MIDFVIAMLIVFAINIAINFVILAGFSAYLSDSPLIAILAIIVLMQLLYVVPWALHLHRTRRVEMRDGLIVGTIITFLINGGCWLFAYSLDANL